MHFYILLGIERFENFLNLFFGVGLAEFSSGEVEEGLKCQSSSMGGIEIMDDIVDEFIASCES